VEVHLDSKITLQQEKARLRAEVLARREALTDRPARDARIQAQLLALPEWRGAKVVSLFVGVKSEVATLPLIAAALGAGKVVAVPVVEAGALSLYRIDDLASLAPAPFGLLEPRPELRDATHRQDPATVDLFIVPGVAFDRNGGRLGYGKGYYDGLLPKARAGVLKIGVGFDVQLVESVPMGPHDVRLSRLITS
jgi:5-formyltetrahydrofolate cyclo-ligase